MKTYTIKKGTNIKESSNEIILKRGVIHKNELIINKEDSSNEFIVTFQKLIKQESVLISHEDSVYDDFETLTKFGFLTVVKSEDEQSLIVVDDELVEKVKTFLNKNIKVTPASSFLTSKEIEILTEDKSILKLSDITEQKKLALAEVEHVYLLTKMLDVSLLRGFNKLMKLIEKVNTIAFFDNENVFVTCIEHGETGCYECLEQQLMSHFEGYANDYIEPTETDISTAELFFALSIIEKEIENINIYSQSSLLGNIIHFNINNYEYSFNTNRIQSCCSTCSTFNNVLFEEQNIRSVNVLKELMSND
ncbi:bacteriocin biosynthesis cyclodehydratase [Marinilactibacillus psychrotolerans]|uniref:bacteriocin biosynthesis cyclodehydratase n=1 Tax=Marinilactibacillus psychrotolerans TaxID=191770 RepID=UPI00388999E1